MASESEYFIHGHTYSANPLSCAIANAVQAYARKHDLYSQVAERGDALHRVLSGLVERHELLEGTEGLGLLRNLAFRAPNPSAQDAPDVLMGMYDALERISLEEGMISCFFLTDRHVGFQLAPPYVIEGQHLQELETKIERIVERLTATLSV